MRIDRNSRHPVRRAGPLIAALSLISACSRSEESTAWQQPVKAKLAEIEANLAELRELYHADQTRSESPATRPSPTTTSRTTAPPVARTKHSPSILEWMIRRDMFAVWELSGRCEFTQVPKVLLAKTGQGIVSRYRDSLAKNSTKPLKDVYREGIEQAIELTNTDYWEPALEVIQTWALLEGSLVSSARFGCPFAPKAIRARMHSEMKAWWKDVAPRLVWKASLRKFTYPDCTAVPGFPAVVMDTWRNPPSLFGTTHFTSPEKAEEDRRQFRELVDRIGRQRAQDESIPRDWK